MSLFSATDFDTSRPSRRRMVRQGIDYATRAFVAEEGDERIDPLVRLFDPAFTDVTWYHDGSKVGDLPGKLHAKQLEASSTARSIAGSSGGTRSARPRSARSTRRMCVLGRHPLQKAGLIRMPPFTAWASALTWELWEKILLPELLSWLPPWRVLDAPPPFKQSTRRDIIVLADNGQESRITGKAAQQGAERISRRASTRSGSTKSTRRSVWDEMQPRLLATAVARSHDDAAQGLTWVHGRVYEPVDAARTIPPIATGTRTPASATTHRSRPSARRRCSKS
jgi:hypothetical protein